MESFLASRYVNTQSKAFADRVLAEKFFHKWWIRAEHNIAYPDQDPLNIMSCGPDDLTIDLQGNPIYTKCIKLKVRDTGPGEFVVEVLNLLVGVGWLLVLGWFLVGSWLLVLIGS